MAPKYSWDRCLHCVFGGHLLRGLAVKNGNVSARLELVLPVNDDALVGGKAGIDQGLSIADMRDLDLADGDGAIGIYDPGIRPVRSLLHDRCGNGKTVVTRTEPQPCVDQLTRPEQAGLVREVGLELN